MKKAQKLDAIVAISGTTLFGIFVTYFFGRGVYAADFPHFIAIPAITFVGLTILISTLTMTLNNIVDRLENQ